MDVRSYVACRPWGVLPAPLWWLVASPCLSWAFGDPFGPGWWRWPKGASRSPLRRSFWRVDSEWVS